MKVNFKKYQGTGNDFVMIDNRNLEFEQTNSKLVESLCDRRFGIGADGLILLQNKAGYDFEMVYFNSDGKESSMCGNGGRCIIQFAKELGIINQSCKFLAVDGEHFGFVASNGIVTIQMSDIFKIEQLGNDFVLNTGSPHYVKFVSDLNDLNIVEEAHKIRYSQQFANDGINVNFVKCIAADSIAIRTYERGVEDETLSCGTGVVAASIANFIHTKNKNAVTNIEARGGKLQVTFSYDENIFSNVNLIGAAVKVFEGTVNI